MGVSVVIVPADVEDLISSDQTILEGLSCSLSIYLIVSLFSLIGSLSPSLLLYSSNYPFIRLYRYFQSYLLFHLTVNWSL